MNARGRARKESDPVRGRGRDRGVTPVVGKTLEAGIVVLYLALLVTVLYGGVVPDHRAAADAELGERVLAQAALELQGAVPDDARTESRVQVDLPATVGDASYRIRATEGSLVLDHPDPAVEGRVSLTMPGDVSRIEGEWYSASTTIVVVERADDGRIVRLEEEHS